MYFLDYQCGGCGAVWELAYESQRDARKQAKCSACGADGNRVYGGAVVIPEYMRAGNESPWDYERSSKKTFF